MHSGANKAYIFTVETLLERSLVITALHPLDTFRARIFSLSGKCYQQELFPLNFVWISREFTNLSNRPFLGASKINFSNLSCYVACLTGTTCNWREVVFSDNSFPLPLAFCSARLRSKNSRFLWYTMKLNNRLSATQFLFKRKCKLWAYLTDFEDPTFLSSRRTTL